MRMQVVARKGGGRGWRGSNTSGEGGGVAADAGYRGMVVVMERPMAVMSRLALLARILEVSQSLICNGLGKQVGSTHHFASALERGG